MKRKPSSQLDKKRYQAASIAMGAMFLVAAASQAKLHTIEREHTVGLAKKSDRFIITRKDRARRGSILSSDGRPLAQDAKTHELVVDFRKVPASQAFYLDLANATGIAAAEFASFAASGAKSRTWPDLISQEEAEAVRRVQKEWRADGLSAANKGEREYPLGAAAACLVGLQLELEGEDGPETVRIGVEASKNTILEGTDGFREGMTDRTGSFLPLRMSGDGKPRVDGKDVTLTIDSELQIVAAKAIENAVLEHKAVNGAAIVLDPRTGNVLAMANYPSFDPNAPPTTQFGYNPAYMAQLEPGSTFKILTLAKALDAGKVSMGTTFHCSGSMVASPRAKPVTCDAHGGSGGGHGALDPVKAIAKSCNVWAAKWAQSIGRTSMIEYLENLGVLERTGIGLPGEEAGLFRRNEYAKDLQLAHVGFGQSITATPIGLASAFSMIANGGVRMKPRLIKRIGSTELPIEKGKQILSEAAAQEVLRCMEAVIHTDMGTGKKLKIAGYRLGGKTGTAEKVGSKRKGYVSNFIGFVPADKPQAVVLVMVNDPHRGYYGGEVAGPAFVDVARSVIRRLEIPPSR